MADIAEGDFEGTVDIDTDALRENTDGVQDWYESRDDDPSLLELDTPELDPNDSKVAKLKGSDTNDAYLTQEFSTPLSGILDVEWDIYVEEIIDIDDARDRAGFMLIGDYIDWGPWFSSPGPNSDDRERFVVMAFYKRNGGTTGTMDLVAQEDDDDWNRRFITVFEDLNLGEWHTIKVRCYIEEDEYNVYVDGNFIQAIPARNNKNRLTHVSFAQLRNGAGTFYVDNVSQTNLYTMLIYIDGQGSVSNSPAGESHDHDGSLTLYSNGTPVTLTPEARPGWKFMGWSGDLTGSDNPATIEMNTDKNLTAHFDEAYRLTVTTTGSGSVALSPEDGPYFFENTTVLLTPEPDQGWQFTGWSGEHSGDIISETIIMDDNKNVTANFEKLTYNVNTEIASGNGTITLDPPSSPYEHGTIVELTAVGEIGWEFIGWGGDLSGTANPATIEIDSDKNVTASFEVNENTYTITFSTDGNGGLSSNAIQEDIPHSASCTPVTAYPARGYQFSNWSGDYTGNENPLTISNVTSDMNITANFVPSHDGNNDGTPDAEQDHIENLTTENQQIVTLEVPEPLEFTSYGPVDNPSSDAMPAGFDFEYGFFTFTIEGLEPGGATTVTIYLPDGALPDTYYKYGPTPDNTDPHWYIFLYDGATGATINENVITLHFVDGQRGDDDLTANGTIDDDGGPGFTNSNSPTGAESQGATGGCFVSSVKPPVFVD